MGVAMTGLSSEYANIRERALFKCTWWQHFVFCLICHQKRGLPLLTEAGAYCVKEQAVETWPIKNSALCYVNVRLPRLTLFRMEQKLWLSSAPFSWSLFKHSPSRGILNRTSSCVPSPPPKGKKKKSADYTTVVHECPESQELRFPCASALLVQPWVSQEQLVENSEAVNFADGMRFWRRSNLY